jgi:hypothetical protein
VYSLNQVSGESGQDQLLLLPFLLGVHLLVVPGLFVLRRRSVSGTLATFVWFGAAGLPLSALYTWAAFGELSPVALAIIVGLSLYTGLIAVAWLVLLQHSAKRKAQTLNKSLNSDAGKAGAG